jgi:hypothetical protein
MKLDVPDDSLPLLIKALEHHYAFTRAVLREDARFQQVADWFKRPPASISEQPLRTVKRKVGPSTQAKSSPPKR